MAEFVAPLLLAQLARRGGEYALKDPGHLTLIGEPHRRRHFCQTELTANDEGSGALYATLDHVPMR